MNKSKPPRALQVFSDDLRRRGWRRFSFSDPVLHSGAEALDLRLDITDGKTYLARLAFFEREGERLVISDFTRAGAEVEVEESPDSLFENYLDLSLCERLVLWGVCRRVGADFLLCARPEGVRLLDADLEIPLGSCPAVFSEEEAAHCLQVLEESGGGRKPLPELARLSNELARWYELAAARLGRDLNWARDDAQRLLKRLLLGFKTLTARKGAIPEANLSDLGLSLSGESDCAVLDWQPPCALALVEKLLEAASDLAPSAGGAFPPLERRALLRQLGESSQTISSLLEDTRRLAGVKFRAEVQLGAFMPTEVEANSWRLALLEPLRVEEEIASEDFYVFQPMELDLSECGVGRVFEAVEKLALHGLRQRKELERAGGWQLDLVETQGEEREREEKLDADPFNWLCRKALRLRVSEGYRETLAYLIASHVVDLKSRPPFEDLPFASLISLPELFRLPRS